MNRNRRLVGYAMLAGAFMMAVLATLFYTETIADTGSSRNAVSLILAGVAAADAAIGIVLVVRS